MVNIPETIKNGRMNLTLSTLKKSLELWVFPVVSF